MSIHKNIQDNFSLKNNVLQFSVKNCELYFLPGNLPDMSKAQEYMKKFNKSLMEDTRLRAHVTHLVGPDCSCKKAEEHVVSSPLLFLPTPL